MFFLPLTKQTKQSKHFHCWVKKIRISDLEKIQDAQFNQHERV